MNDKDKKLWTVFCETRKKEVQSCPDDIMLSAYVDGSLPKSDISYIESHLSECETCLDIVSQITLASDDNGDSNENSVLILTPNWIDLNRKIFTQIFPSQKQILNISFMKVAAIAASLIAVISVTIIMQSGNTKRAVTTDEVVIARVIELYNNNKYYQISENSNDGFSPSENYSVGVRHNSHKADINSNGRISMNEVLQYIAKN